MPFTHGSHHSEETKAKMRGRVVSEETKAKLREARLRQPDPRIGKHASEETRVKMREARLRQPDPRIGKHHSEETKAKLRAIKGEKHVNWIGDKAKPDTGRCRAERMYECPKGMERHHIDGNPLNNAPENIAFVTRKEHMKLDGRITKDTLKSTN